MIEPVSSLPDDIFELQRDVGWLVFDVSRLFMQAMERRVREVGITPQQWRVLVQIAREEGQTQSQLAYEAEIAPAPLGRLLDRLEEQRIIERRPDSLDRRIRRIYLFGGEQGPFFERVRLLARQQFEIVYRQVSQAHQMELQRILAKLKSNMLESAPELAVSADSGVSATADS